MTGWRALVAAGVGTLGLASAAASIGAAKVPPGWTLDGATSQRASAATQAQYRARGRAAQVEVEGHVAPGGPASLYITRVREELAIEQPVPGGADTLAQRRSEIVSEKLSSLTRTAADSQGQVVSSTQRWVADGMFVEGTIRWQARDTGLRVSVRTLVAANPAGISAITGECFLGADASAALDRACQQALDTLTLDLPVTERVAIAIDAAPATASPPAVDIELPAAPARGRDTAARLDEGPPGAVMRMSPSPRDADQRPVYIGAFIVVMAAVFWWNRRRRERFERDDQQPRDDDADDLAAAARGDEKDSP